MIFGNLQFKGLRLDKEIVGQIYKIGVPSMIMPGHWFRDDLWDEPDSDFLYFHGHSGVWCIF